MLLFEEEERTSIRGQCCTCGCHRCYPFGLVRSRGDWPYTHAFTNRLSQPNRHMLPQREQRISGRSFKCGANDECRRRMKGCHRWGWASGVAGACVRACVSAPPRPPLSHQSSRPVLHAIWRPRSPALEQPTSQPCFPLSTVLGAGRRRRCSD